MKTLARLAVVTCMAFGFPVSAAPITREKIHQPVKMCQAARPAHEGFLRKRPLAISNEGTTSAYVSCGFDSAATANTFYVVAVSFLNHTATDIEVSCTLVDGLYVQTQPAWYYPKTITVFAASGGDYQEVVWSSDEDNGSDLFDFPAVSCVLPPGVEMARLYSTYAESYPD